MGVPCRSGVFYDTLYGSSPPSSTKEKNTTLPHALSLLARGGRPPPRAGSSSRGSLGGYSTYQLRAKQNSPPDAGCTYSVGVPPRSEKKASSSGRNAHAVGVPVIAEQKKILLTVLRPTTPAATSPRACHRRLAPVASSSRAGASHSRRWVPAVAPARSLHARGSAPTCPNLRHRKRRAAPVCRPCRHQLREANR